MTVKEMLEAHNIDPQDVLNAELGRRTNKGIHANASIASEGFGDIGHIELTVYAQLPQRSKT